MALAINTVSSNFILDTVANPKKVSYADQTADSAGTDLGTNNRWAFQALIKIKASNNTVTAALVFADNSALSTNPVYCGQAGVMGSARLGTIVLNGVCDDAKQFVGVDVTLGGTCTYDAVIYLSPLS